jgi:hypothetical protein
MCDLVFIDDPDDIYIHPIVEKFDEMGIEEKEDIDEYGLVQKEHKYKIISIDIGITHLGFSLGITDKAFNLIHLEWVNMIDITKYTHNFDLHDKECGIDHSSNQFADWLQHFFLEYKTLFDISDFILIEKQPPKGLVVIEQIIMFNYREKCHLVHPRSMHSFFGIGSTNINGENSYEERKKQTQIIAQRCADWHPRALDYYSKLQRKHDVTDAICLMLFWLRQQNKIYTREENIRRMTEVKMSNSNMSGLEYLEQFRYIQY